MKSRYVLMGVAAVALALGLWWYIQKPASYSYSLDTSDSITTWNFQGSHNDSGDLEKKVHDDIKNLESQLQNKEGEPTDYSIYVSIANQYTLLGDGAKAYEYLLFALAEDSEKTGLAWYNMGSLMERLGAYATARDAYGRAVEAQPHVEQYQVSLINFLQSHFPDDTSAIEAAFAGAEAQFKAPSVFQIKAAWLTSIGRFEDAIQAWKDMQATLPANDPMIEKEIAKLRARL